MALLRSKRRVHNHSDTETDSPIPSDTETVSHTDNNGKIFEIIGELPASIETPNYNSTLTHSLSIKDSAVLYNSLIISRNTWIHNMGNIFALYWLKDGTNAYEKSFTGFSIKDKMQKMCDATLFGGPHSFPIRLFILKDEDIEREWQELQEQKKVDKQKKKEDVIQLKQLKQEERAKKRELREKIKEEQKKVKLQSKLENEKLRLERKEQLKKLKLELKSKQKIKIPKTTTTTNNNNTIDNKMGPSNNSPVNDTNMIANLNKMAQNDANLSTLMKKVAKGLASKEEVERFKKMIDIAKKMPGETTTNINIPMVTRPIPPLLPLQKSPTPSTQEPVYTINTANSHLIDPNIKQETHDSMEPSIIPKRPISTNSIDSSIPASSQQSVENITIKDENVGTKKKPGRKPKSKDTNDESEDRLTTFQTKYLKNATLLIEFIEDKNIRYYLPRESIIELVESDNEFIISFIVIHNMREMNKFARRCKTDWSTELLFKENCPKAMFSTITISIKDIPKRFHPIMLNSMKPMEQTQKWMKKVIDDGIRLSGYHLWYQLDGYDDSELAENLRQNLVNYENGLKPKRLRKV